MNQRIKNIRKELGLNQTEMSKTLGLQQGSYSTLESGKSGLSFPVRKIYIDNLNVNPDYIDKGKEPIFLMQTKHIENADSSELETLRKTNQQLEDYIKLQKKVIEGFERDFSEVKQLITTTNNNVLKLTLSPKHAAKESK